MGNTVRWICSNQLRSTSVIHGRRAPAGLKRRFHDAGEGKFGHNLGTLWAQILPQKSMLNRKLLIGNMFRSGAGRGGRTPMGRSPADFESAASADSAIPAGMELHPWSLPASHAAKQAIA